MGSPDPEVQHDSSTKQDPIARVEQALSAMRSRQFRGDAGGPGRRAGAGGPPWARGLRPGQTIDPDDHQKHHNHGDSNHPDSNHQDSHHQDSHQAGPPQQPAAHDRVGGAARFRLLDALITAESASQQVGISEVAQSIGVDQPRASRLINEAVDRGLVTRTPDPRDARRSVVRISEAGRTMLDAARTHRRSAVTDAMSGFTTEEQASFADLFSRFVAAWHR